MARSGHRRPTGRQLYVVNPKKSHHVGVDLDLGEGADKLDASFEKF
jgi:hypothetical protein